MRIAIRVAMAALLLTGSGSVAASVPSEAASCYYGSERYSVIHAHPDGYSSWLNAVYFKYQYCNGSRYAILVTRIDTRFHTDFDPPYPIKRKIVYVDIRRNSYAQPVWLVQPTNKYCYNACTIQGTWYPGQYDPGQGRGQYVLYSTDANVGVVCQTCWPGTNEAYELNHYFVSGTYSV